jgi:hypothetical protein
VRAWESENVCVGGRERGIRKRQTELSRYIRYRLLFILPPYLHPFTLAIVTKLVGVLTCMRIMEGRKGPLLSYLRGDNLATRLMLDRSQPLQLPAPNVQMSSRQPISALHILGEWQLAREADGPVARNPRLPRGAVRERGRGDWDWWPGGGRVCQGEAEKGVERGTSLEYFRGDNGESVTLFTGSSSRLSERKRRRKCVLSWEEKGQKEKAVVCALDLTWWSLPMEKDCLAPFGLHQLLIVHPEVFVQSCDQRLRPLRGLVIANEILGILDFLWTVARALI